MAAQPDLQPAEKTSQPSEGSGRSKTSDEWLRSSEEPVESSAPAPKEEKPSARKAGGERSGEVGVGEYCCIWSALLLTSDKGLRANQRRINRRKASSSLERRRDRYGAWRRDRL